LATEFSCLVDNGPIYFKIFLEGWLGSTVIYLGGLVNQKHTHIFSVTLTSTPKAAWLTVRLVGTIPGRVFLWRNDAPATGTLKTASLLWLELIGWKKWIHPYDNHTVVHN
jgi:hypothetical protein